jgi:hypothetical protein
MNPYDSAMQHEINHAPESYLELEAGHTTVFCPTPSRRDYETLGDFRFGLSSLTLKLTTTLLTRDRS